MASKWDYEVNFPLTPALFSASSNQKLHGCAQGTPLGCNNEKTGLRENRAARRVTSQNYQQFPDVEGQETLFHWPKASQRTSLNFIQKG
ncbi:MAG: hypothetical protein O7I42_04230, partial [Alphaproteobacteria bacterium]|nr:hypothetical protein [Alphaproteobacteria bacterium]